MHTRGERCGEPHGRDDLDMRAAAAKIEAQGFANVGFGRIRVGVEEGARGHDHAVETIAALRRCAGDERLLDRIELVAVGQALERRQAPPFDIRKR